MPGGLVCLGGPELALFQLWGLKGGCGIRCEPHIQNHPTFAKRRQIWATRRFVSSPKGSTIVPDCKQKPQHCAGALFVCVYFRKCPSSSYVAWLPLYAGVFLSAAKDLLLLHSI